MWSLSLIFIDSEAKVDASEMVRDTANAHTSSWIEQVQSYAISPERQPLPSLARQPLPVIDS